jgi:hypothetical protein
MIIAEGRQKLADPDFFTYHPPELSDSFTFHLKAVMVAVRVSEFNSTVKKRRDSDIRNGYARSSKAFNPSLVFSDDRQLASKLEQLSLQETEEYEYPDITQSDWFRSIDRLIRDFRQNVPKQFINPFSPNRSQASSWSNGVYEKHEIRQLFAAHSVLEMSVTQRLSPKKLFVFF